MPTNLPPHYYEAERTFRKAKTVPEKVAALQEMMSATPKHKGTDHLRADMRARMARLMEELERPKPGGGGLADPFALRKEGAGRAVLVGLANAGKSQLLASLTGAAARVASYRYTTQTPLPGMLQFENVRIQMVDTPSIDARQMQTRLFSLLRSADLLLLVLDLEAGAIAQIEEVTAELERWGYRLLGAKEDPDIDDHRVQKRAIVVGNKADADGALEEFQRLSDRYGDRFPVLMVSTAEEVGLNELTEATFRALGKVRVYTKAPGEDPSYGSPVVLLQGSVVQDAAEALHKDWKRRLRYALLWGSGKFDSQRVGRDYVLADGDVLEFHG